MDAKNVLEFKNVHEFENFKILRKVQDFAKNHKKYKRKRK